MYRFRLATFTLAAILSAPFLAHATIVRYDTVLGSFDVRLFDTATPLTTGNLLDYVNADAYDGTFVHRSISGFVLQGGGHVLSPDIFNTFHIPTNPSVENEPGISNIRNSIAMAKQGGDPDSATSQWFFSVNHNTENLDNQNGGFTVFGFVLGDGMDVVDAIVALATINVPPQFSGVPVLDFDKVVAQQNVFEEDAVIFNSISVIELPDGDYDFDGNVDGADLAIWEADYGRLKLIGGDFNDDKEIDRADLTAWENGYGQQGGSVDYTDGDSNGDKKVDGVDFLTWQQGSGGTVDVAADGDGSAQINGLDFLLWQQDFGASSLSSINSIPEPATLLLLCLAALANPRAIRRVL